MKKQSGYFSKLLPSTPDTIEIGADLDKGYKYFSRGLSVILIVLVLVPMTIISILSHYQYQKLLQQEEMDQLLLSLEQAQNTIEKFVSELQSVVKFVARDDCYPMLLDPKKLEGLFVQLHNEYPDFVDIEVIDSQGMQKAYYGPYQLMGYNYSDQTWYKEVLLQDVFISNIFSGFRHVPHFVIAVRRQLPRQSGSWILRFTLDGKTLQNFVDTINTSYADDIFLVDSEGLPQTIPQKYGKIGEKCMPQEDEQIDQKCILPALEETSKKSFMKRLAERNLMLNNTSEMMVVQKSFQGKHVIAGVVDIVETPWRLVLVKEQYLHADTWHQFQSRLITIFIFFAIIAVFVIVKISNALTNHIRESDKKRRQLLAEAEQPNKLVSIGRLAAGVAHEINNPLAIINQKAGLAQDFMEMSEDSEHKKPILEALDGIQNSVERCKKITHRLLGFARQTDVRTEKIDINDIVREVVDFLAKEASYNQIKIDFDLDQNISKIFSDSGQLQQIFLNITNNAIDAIGSNGQITLSSKQVDQQTVQVNIIDNGPGISPEVQQRIFDPFFTTKETGKGTGLGLSITYGLVKKLGGNIKVISEVGKGTTFKITLPVTQG